MSFPVYYRAWDASANEPALGDAANHTVTLVVNGADINGLTPSEEGNGIYVVTPSDAQLPAGARFILHGSSSSDDVYLLGDSGVRPEPMRGTDGAATSDELQQAADAIQDDILAVDNTLESIADGSTVIRASTSAGSEIASEQTASDAASHAEQASSRAASILSKLAGMTNLAHWLRALVRKDGADTSVVNEINDSGGTFDPATDSQEAIRERGDAAWKTASGFATPEQVADAAGAIIEHGDEAWVGGGDGGGQADWTEAERKQIRHQLGVDGEAEQPEATPALATRQGQEQILGAIDRLDRVVVSPLDASVKGTRVTGPKIELYQFETRTIVMPVRDGEKQPVDLSGMTLRFVVHDEATPKPTGLMEIGGITISGDDNDQANVRFTSQHTQTQCTATWSLWDVQDEDEPVYLGRGGFRVAPALSKVE